MYQLFSDMLKETALTQRTSFVETSRHQLSIIST